MGLFATRKPNPQIVKYINRSILEATDGGTNRLIAVVPVQIVNAVVQTAAPGGVDGGLSSTPEKSDASNILETTSANAITTWESRETT